MRPCRGPARFASSCVVLLTLGLGVGRAGPASAVCTQPALLQPGSFYSLGLRTRDAALADFNHDGILDLAVTCPDNLNSTGFNNSIAILLGLGIGGVGNGSFGPATFYPTGTRPMMIVAGDFNEDGIPDLATANWGGNSVSILLGRGDGTVGAPGTFATGPNPYAIVTGDFNDDGILDLATANNGAATVSVLIGLGSGSIGNGTFAPPANYAIANLSTSLAIGDLDGDGIMDLVATANYSGRVSVLMGKKDGTFADAQSYPAGVEPFVVVIRDFDADGIPDLAVGNAQSAGITVLKGVGDGSFQAPNLQGSGSNIAGLAIADFNQDGIQDLAAACNTTNNLKIFLGQGSGGVGDGTFVLQGSYSGPTFPLAVVVGDLNADGSSDAVATSYGNGAVVVMLGGCGLALTERPNLVSVRDVPNDQGGRVFLRWMRSSLDVPLSGSVTGYRVWRRLPPGAAAARAASASGAALRTRPAAPDAVAFDYWEAIATLPAEGLSGYGYTAATTQDSMAGSNPFTAFFVTALTASAGTFYESNVDSGYSVDNLAPPTPSPFAVEYGSLSNRAHWAGGGAPDLLEFRVYRGSTADFVPGPGTLVIATRDSACVDAAGPAFYKLLAVDLHGNVSRCAWASPSFPVGGLVSLVSVEPLADRVRLSWYAGDNPGLPVTVERRVADGPWTVRRDLVADGTGQLRYEDTDVTIGTRYGYRLEIQDGGAKVYAGEAWTTPEPWTLALEGARPNPARTGRLVVQFVLSAGGPAELELFDVGGRRWAARDVGALGVGPHSVTLGDERRIPPGVYLLRIRQGAQTRIARAVVLD